MTDAVHVQPAPRWLDHLFLVGLALVFLVNAVVAAVEPEAFIRLVRSSPPR